MFPTYDILVAGGGHAGCEAAATAARLGSRVLLVSMDLDKLAQMSCNPAMGGIAKGQIVREIDALGGLTARVTDGSMVQFRMLNRSKGPAMWSPRSQNDRMMFSALWREALEGIQGLDFWQDAVTELIVSNGRLQGARTAQGHEIQARAVIITSGTFLNGTIHIGKQSFSGGRLGEAASVGLTEHLRSLGFRSDRLKTGTPVRVDRFSVDFSKMEEQPGDNPPGRFSYLDGPALGRQLSCFLAYTNPKVHDILQEGFEASPLFAGRIQGSGPRYCPSIEDKIVRFSQRDRHQLFVEPEGRSTRALYINGFSSSLPVDVQYRALRAIEGFEKARVIKPGYAIEYDYFPPDQLDFTLESKRVEHLYLAGQVNGTTGYEEAACQGLMAGINAHRKLKGESRVVLKRSDAYIGVLIDDLITKGTQEPYRMFTSRAEYRTLLRQDNADARLTPLGYALGLAGEERIQRLREKTQMMEAIRGYLKANLATPGETNDYLLGAGTTPIERNTRMENLVLRPQVALGAMGETLGGLKKFLSAYRSHPLFQEALSATEVQIKYEGYMEKERTLAARMSRLEDIGIPSGTDYNRMLALSAEAREKLQAVRPGNLGQAARVSGVSPADISILLVHLGR